MDDEILVPVQRVLKKPFILFRIIQWAVFAFMVLFVLINASDLGKSNVPGAPLAYLYLCIGVSVVLALVHLPFVFWRLPSIVKWAAYIALLPAFALFGDYYDTMRAAYVRTPAGAKEVAERAKADREEAARLKAETDSEARRQATEKQAAMEAKKPELCQTLAGQVVDGTKILEINNVVVEPSYVENEILTCSGDAITSHGNMKIEIGLVKTPQGKSLVATRFP